MQGTYSTNVRFPGEMKGRMQEAATEEFRSLNSLIVAAVDRYLTEREQTRKAPEAQEALSTEE